VRYPELRRERRLGGKRHRCGRGQRRGGEAAEEKSEVACSTLHHIYTVAGVRARGRESILDSSAFSHMPGDFTNPSTIWHQRYVIGLPVSEENSSDETLCTGSALGKFDRKPYRPSGRKATNILEKFHIGIEGPMEVSIIGGFNYFLILVEDCSGYITVFVIQAKSQALQHYTTFRDQVWSQLYKRVSYSRCIRYLTVHILEEECTQWHLLCE